MMIKPQAAFAAVLLTCLIEPALAQAPGSNLAANYAANAGQPINIDADSLEVDDQKKFATFRGNVNATQGDFNLKAKEIQVKYTSRKDSSGGNKGTETAGPGGDSQITEINAKGKVLITTKDNQTATSDWARFDVLAQTVTIGGNVVLSQGPNTIKGGKLVIDLTTGLSRFEDSGRVRSIFSSKSRPKPKN